MKLREFDFNKLKFLVPVGLAIRVEGGEWYESLTVGETLKMIPKYFADLSIKETRWYFNKFVIELEKPLT